MIIILHACWDSRVINQICILNNSSVTATGLRPRDDQIIKKKCELNCYFVSLFMTTLGLSSTYKFLVIKYLIKRLQIKPFSVVRIKIAMCQGKHIIDSRWSDILNRLCYEKRELYNAMAWLSTLGGAFSALGDVSADYALVAGRISMQQFKIALKLGDPPTVARCRLFYALSLIQCGKLKQARDLIQVIYRTATIQYANDKRLQRMCHGIWNKLRYEWENESKRKFLTYK